MLNTADKIIRAKIGLGKTHPFFAYLCLQLQEKEFDEELEKELAKSGRATMGVDVYSNLYYSKKFVDSLSEEELKFSLCHEVLHLAFLHLLRKKERDEMLWNISADVCINTILKNNKFELIKGALLPNDNDKFVINNGKIKVKDVSKKCAEEIYDELYGKLPKATKEQLAKGNGIYANIRRDIPKHFISFFLS